MTQAFNPASCAELRRCINDRAGSGTPIAYLFFWGHRQAQNGAIGKSCFSQWYPAPFAIDGVSYSSAEHYMMAAKARLFGDTAALAKVLAAPSPGAAKEAGRGVQGFDEARWCAHRWDIVVNANLAKFDQNPALGAFLRATGALVLVEASPVDAVWGIGLSADDPAAQDPASWKGLNLLGFALMQVRARLGAAQA